MGLFILNKTFRFHSVLITRNYTSCRWTIGTMRFIQGRTLSERHPNTNFSSLKYHKRGFFLIKGGFINKGLLYLEISVGKGRDGWCWEKGAIIPVYLPRVRTWTAPGRTSRPETEPRRTWRRTPPRRAARTAWTCAESTSAGASAAKIQNWYVDESETALKPLP